MLRAVPSGGSCRNDIMLQGGSSCLPFGGLGTSGYGNYHGKYSMDAFTHAFGSVYRPCLPGSDFGMVRYHPYKGWRRFMLINVLGKLPYTPVLHCRTVALGASIALALVCTGVGFIEGRRLVSTRQRFSIVGRLGTRTVSKMR